MMNNNKYSPPEVESYLEQIARLFAAESNDKAIEVTFQITEDCCLNCSYCYQHHKTKNKISFEIAKIAIDNLLNDKIQICTKDKVKGIVLDFIVVEPLLEIELIEQIVEYYFTKGIKIKHPWIPFTRISICSNGVLYFNNKVQNFIKKYSSILSFCISIDGSKELHDKCRVDFQGQGSYDIAIAAAKDYMKKYNPLLSTKMTITHENLKYLSSSIENLINEGYKQIHFNCVYENVWKDNDEDIFYNELIKIADYLIKNNLYNKIYISIFGENIGKPVDPEENNNWCGGTLKDQSNFAIDYKGDIFLCIRYMESSLNGKQKPLNIGNIYHGMFYTDEEKNNAALLNNITRKEQSTEECFNCEVASGCGWCSGYNYEELGTPKKRLTYICKMHKARVKANKYFLEQINKGGT